MAKSLFREDALKKLSSPEQLDQAIQITSARAWIWLAGLAVVMAAGLMWGFFGSIPTRVNGAGIIIYEGGEVFPAESEGQGKLLEILVEPGQSVEKGEVVAKINQVSLEEKIRAAKENMAALELQRDKLAEGLRREDKKRKKMTKMHLAAFAHKENALRDRLAYLEKQLNAREAKLKKGIDRPEQAEIRAAVRKIVALLDQRKKLTKKEIKEGKERAALTRQQQGALERKAKNLRERAAYLEKLLKERETLIRAGLVTPEQEEVDTAKRSLATLESQRKELQKRLDHEETETDVYTRKQIRAHNHKIQNLQQRVGFLERSLKGREILLKEGIVPPRHVEEKREMLSQTRQEINEVRVQIERIRLSRVKERHEASRRLVNIENEILKARNRLQTARSRSRLSEKFDTTLQSSVEGTREKLHQTRQKVEETKVEIERFKLSELEARRRTRARLYAMDINILEARNQEKTLRSRATLTEKFETPLVNLVENTREKYHQTMQGLADVKGQLLQLRLPLLEAENQARQRMFSKNNEILEARQKLRFLETRIGKVAHVESPVTGIVQEYDTSVGSVVSAGTVILTVAARQYVQRGNYKDDLYDALIFVESGNAKLIEPGMTAQVSPSTAKREEFGTIVGKVEKVSESPSSERHLFQVLQNKRLAREFSQQGAPFMMRVVLKNSKETKSGFKWSSGVGPPFPVTAGTLCSASVIVRRQAPITLVIPFFKKILHR